MYEVVTSFAIDPAASVSTEFWTKCEAMLITEYGTHIGPDYAGWWSLGLIYVHRPRLNSPHMPKEKNTVCIYIYIYLYIYYKLMC